MSESHNQLIQRWAVVQNLLDADSNAATGKSLDRLAVTVDTVRVHLIEISAGRVLVEARVTDVLLAEREKAELLERMLKAATARMRHSGITLAVDAAESAFWLQSTVQADAELKTLTSVVEQLTHEVELWRKAL
jgi:hypothetical protein